MAAKANPKAKAKNPPPKTAVTRTQQRVLPISAPLYPLLGVKRVAFKQAAALLSQDLISKYGEEVTITKFEHILLEIRGRSDLRDKIYLEEYTLNLHKNYILAKAEMIEEQNMFAQSFHVIPRTAQLAVDNLDDLFSPSP